MFGKTGQLGLAGLHKSLKNKTLR